MQEELIQFRWDVSEEGYQWIELNSEPNEKQKTPFLTTGIPVGVGGFLVKRYNPLQMYSALYREFSEMDLSQEAILNFANMYGTLGGSTEQSIHLPHPDDPDRTVIGVGESFDQWKKNIHLMKQLLVLWDAVQQKDIDTLSNCILWDHSYAVRYQTPSNLAKIGTTLNEWIAHKHMHSELLEHFKSLDLVQPAMYFIQRKINQQMKGHISQRLLWDNDHKQLSLYSVPDSLIAALWLQFAQAISSKKTYRRCHQCNTWFELTPDIARTNRLYCSNACRSKSYRNRQASAKKLFIGGKTVEEISDQLNVDSTTIRKWIAEKQ